MNIYFMITFTALSAILTMSVCPEGMARGIASVLPPAFADASCWPLML
jgi:hypothetical protein